MVVWGYAGVSSVLIVCRVPDMRQAPTWCRGLSVLHFVDGVDELCHVGFGDASPAFDRPVEYAANEFPSGFGRDVVFVH